MPYNLLVGNPYNPAQAEAAFAVGARRRRADSFVRRMQIHEIRLSARQQEIQLAQVEAQRAASAMNARIARERIAADERQAEKARKAAAKQQQAAIAQRNSEVQAAQQAQAEAAAARQKQALLDVGARDITEQANSKGYSAPAGNKLFTAADGTVWEITPRAQQLSQEKAAALQKAQQDRMQQALEEQSMLNTYAPNAKVQPPGVAIPVAEGQTVIFSSDGRQIVGPREELQRIMDIRLRRSTASETPAAPKLSQPQMEMLNQVDREIKVLESHIADAKKDGLDIPEPVKQQHAEKLDERERLVMGAIPPEHRAKISMLDTALEGYMDPKAADEYALLRSQLVNDLMSADPAMRQKAEAKLNKLLADYEKPEKEKSR